MEQKRKKNSRMISFRMPEPQIELLTHLAIQTGQSKSEILRAGLQLLKQQNIKEGGGEK